MIAPEHVAELAKEFGGGFAAYWTHHVFHRLWAALSRKPPPH